MGNGREWGIANNGELQTISNYKKWGKQIMGYDRQWTMINNSKITEMVNSEWQTMGNGRKLQMTDNSTWQTRRVTVPQYSR